MATANWHTNEYKKQMKIQEGLKPCPFCGNKAELTYGWHTEYNYMIACNTQDCVMMISYEVGCESIAERWNNREQPAQGRDKEAQYHHRSNF